MIKARSFARRPPRRQLRFRAIPSPVVAVVGYVSRSLHSTRSFNSIAIFCQGCSAQRWSQVFSFGARSMHKGRQMPPPRPAVPLSLKLRSSIPCGGRHAMKGDLTSTSSNTKPASVTCQKQPALRYTRVIVRVHFLWLRQTVARPAA